MAGRLPPADLSGVRTQPLAERKHKVSSKQFARPIGADDSAAELIRSLPDLLGARALRGLARAIVDARAAGRPVIWAVGGHVVKSGVTPVLVRLIRGDMITGIAMNGAAAIHDWEIASVGSTSEDVDATLGDGSFGVGDETGRDFNRMAQQAAAGGFGLGEVLTQCAPGDGTLLGSAGELSVPTTVHVAIGSDVTHTHPTTDGAALGAATYTDFRRLVTMVSDLSGGVWINCGSAVQLPEVFLKALTVARNLGHEVRDFTTANLDMQRQYRTEQNVLRRPIAQGGKSYELIGHHEIMVPLLALAIEAHVDRGPAPKT